MKPTTTNCSLLLVAACCGTACTQWPAASLQIDPGTETSARDSGLSSPDTAAPPHDSDSTSPTTDSSAGNDDSGQAFPDAPGTPGVPNDDSDALFDLATVHRFQFEIDSESWASLSIDPDEYAPITFGDGTETFSLAVRVKGSSTYESISNKPSFKVDVNAVDPDKLYHGKKKFNLHNQVLDPSYVSEALTYAFFREAGLPAPRVGYAWLTINGQDVGLYTIVEEPDDEFIDLWFEDDDGNLYENIDAYCDLDDGPNCFDAEEFDEKNHDAFLRLAVAASTTGDTWDAELSSLMDWPLFTRFMAMEAAIGHWDSYSYDLSNYRLYHQPSVDEWTFVPWSGDLSFSYRPWSYPNCGQYATDPAGYDMGLLAAGCEASASCTEAKNADLLVIADQIDAFDAEGRISSLNSVMRAFAADDPNRTYGMDDYDDHQACIVAFLSTRGDYLRNWVENHTLP